MSRKPKARLPSATSLVARSFPDRIIGVENALPWHLGTDLKHFKQRTSGHAIIMGRKTFESIGRPLPNRENIVLSRSSVEETHGVKWAESPETALLLADQFSIINLKTQFFVIGGEEIYKLFYKYINVIFLTEVSSGPINGDAKFDFDFDTREWWYKFEREFPKSDIDDFPFRIACIIRRRPFHRFASQSEFLHRNPKVLDAWDRYQEMMAREQSKPLATEYQLDLLSHL